MSSTIIDQLFPITPRQPTGREASPPDPGGGDLFRAHLKRASDTSTAQLPKVSDQDEVAGSEQTAARENESLVTWSEQQETSTSQHEDPPATTDSPDSTDSPEGSPETAAAGDEVTLSAASVAETGIVEIAAAVEQDGNAEGAVETAATPNPRPSGQPTANLTETSSAANAATAAEGAIGTATGSFGEETEGEGSGGRQAAEAAIAVPKHSADRSEATDAKPTSAAPHPTTAASQGTNASEGLLETEVTENSAPRGERNPEPSVSPAGSGATSTTIDTELNVAPPGDAAAETSAAATNTATTSPGSESVVSAERLPGSVLTDRATDRPAAAARRESSDTPTVDRARFVQRVGGAIRTAQQRDGQIQLRLSPPELGTLRIQISVNEGVVTAKLETETAAARTVLLDNLPALRERLAEQEIRIEKFDVDVRRDGQPPPDQPGAEEQQTNNSRARTTATSKSVPAQESAPREADLSHAAAASGLDVRI